MKKVITFFFLFISLQSKADSWIAKSNFGGTSRHAATGFFLNGKGYIGTGGTFSVRKKDFWQWDPSTNVWTQKADFGGSGRSGAVGFAIGNLGYIATGFANSLQKDMWAYDPTANTWTQKADLGGSARHYAVAFELDGMGYLGTGTGSVDLKDFWQYNPSTNTWMQKANFGGSARSSAASFSLNGKGYIGTGYLESDFWEYDPLTDTWTQKASFGAGLRSDAVGFAICNKGYIGTGVSSSVSKKDLWEYDPTLNTWTQKADFGGSGRENAVGFSDGTYGYVGTGTNIFSEFGDFFQYTGACTVLPIGLTSFVATPLNGEVKITWTTESEFNNDYFTVEKSLDGIHFEIIAIVTGEGNSTSPLNYEVKDLKPFSGINYYRLKQTDFDNTYEYSSVISCVSIGIGMMRVLGVNPNPVESIADVITDLTDDEDLFIQIYDSKGQLVFNSVYDGIEGIQHHDVNLSNLSQGIYFIKVHCEYGSYSQKLIKVN